MTQNNITNEQVDKIGDRYYHAALARVKKSLGVRVDPNSKVVLDGLESVYSALYDRKFPGDIVVYDSPVAMLKGENETRSSGLGCAQIDLCEQIAAARELLGQELTEDERNIRELCYTVYDACLGDECVGLVGWPDVCLTDESGDLHCETGPAVSWPGQEEFFWHGQAVDKVVIMDPDAVSGDYLKSLPAEQRRATYEAIGHDRAIKALGLIAIDKDEIDGLSYELYRSGEESWLRMQSPVLQDGSQPFYVEPVHEDCESCEEALGWRATGELGVSVRYQNQA